MRQKAKTKEKVAKGITEIATVTGTATGIATASLRKKGAKRADPKRMLQKTIQKEILKGKDATEIRIETATATNKKHLLKMLRQNLFLNRKRSSCKNRQICSIRLLSEVLHKTYNCLSSKSQSLV